MTGSRPPGRVPDAVHGDVAIIGMACVFPGAPNLQTYWDNILHKVNAVGDPPPEWEAELFLDPAAEGNDRLYCARGGYLGPLAAFDPIQYGIMPNSVDGTEPDHFLALRAAYESLGDAGYLQRDLDHSRTEVIIGRGTYVNRGNATVVQHALAVDSVLRVLKQLHPEHTDEELAAIRRELKASLPAFHAETAPGLVPNIISGRIANRLDLMGPSYLVDAACASSLVAVDLGMRDLLTGRCDLALVGGVHASTPPPIVMIFCQLKAISKRGEIRPFDSGADGTLLGEGVGMIALKRRADAERDGDRIYAVIKSVGVASDGKALGLLAPRLEGEALALRRAYEAAGVRPQSVGLIEAHGTATPVGDVVELEALNSVFGPRDGELPTCALGSVKSMISHLMPASGIAGLIKAALAVHHRVLPPTINCEQPNPRLGLETSRFYLNTETRPWIHGSPDAPRRAGVNAFGFGGINAHVVIEEYTGPAPSPALLQHRWDTEAFVLSGESRAELLEHGNRVLQFLVRSPQVCLKDLAYTMNAAGEPGPVRLALVAGSPEELAGKLTRALARVRDERCRRIRDVEGVYFASEPLAHRGELAWIFPGEGSQYPNMLGDLCVHFPEVRRVFDFMDRVFANHPRGYLPSHVIFPPPQPDGRQADGRIYRMDSGAEAVFAANQAIVALLQALGIAPQAMVGHSTGEHSALLAAGAVRSEDAGGLTRHILDVNAIFEQLHAKGAIPHGMLVAVGGVGPDALRAIVTRADGRVHVAMDNCPHQTVLCGDETAMAGVVAALQAERGICQTLPFARAYHTPWFEVFCEPMREYFARVPIDQPGVRLYSCVTAERYPADPDAIRELVATQWARTVRFRETVEAMYRDGVRLFVEAGPRATLCGFVDDILRGKPYAAIASNVQHRTGIAQLNHLVGQLAVHGVQMRLGFLYERRAPERLDLGPAPRAKAAARAPVQLATGLQPLRLPPGFQIRRPAPQPLRAAPDSGRAAHAPAHAPAESVTVAVESVTAPAESVRARAVPANATPVIARHLQTMDEFLRLQSQVMHGYLAGRSSAVPPPPPRQGPTGAAAGPWVGDVVDLVPGRRATAHRRIDLSEDVLFRDHTLGRDVSAWDRDLLALPVVPLTITMEMLAEIAALLQPGRVVVGMRDLRASRWITLEGQDVTLELSAVSSETAPGEVRASVRERGAVGTSGPVIAEAVVQFASEYPRARAVEPLRLRNERSSAWTPAQLYREGMFHGPSFQTVKAITRYGDDGVVARMQALPRAGLLASAADPGFLTDAVVLDGAGQVLAYWVKEQLGILVDVFPYGLEQLRCYGPPPAPGSVLECRVRGELIGMAQTRCNIEIVDASGALLYELEGWKDRRFELPAPFVQLRIAPAESELSEPWHLPLAGVPQSTNIACRRLTCLGQDILKGNGGIWLKVLAHLVLSRRERETWQAMTGVPKRRHEWLLGRVVAKDAVRQLVFQRTGVRLAPADVEIEPDTRGRPEVKGEWCTRLGILPVVSISHSGGVAVALAALDRRYLIGVDIESVSGRTGGFEKAAFTPGERELLAQLDENARREWYLRLWCAKEAVGKALGRGLAGGPAALDVRAAQLGDGAVTLRLGAPLAVDFPELHGRDIVTYTARDGDFVSSAIVHPRGEGAARA